MNREYKTLIKGLAAVFLCAVMTVGSLMPAYAATDEERSDIKVVQTGEEAYDVEVAVTEAIDQDVYDEDTMAETEKDDLLPAISATGGQIATEDFLVKLSFGIEGLYCMNTPIPVSVDIECLQDDFEGYIRVIIPSNPSNDAEAIAYEKNILLTRNVPQRVSMAIFNYAVSSNVYFQIEDNKGHVLVDERVKMKIQPGTSAIAGLLCDESSRYAFLNGMEIALDEYEEPLELVELNEKTMTDVSSGLAALSFLIIDDYDTSRLSQAQLAAIDNWVTGGGVLILGTGARYKEVLSGLPEKLVAIDASGMGSGIFGTKEDGVSYDAGDGILKMTMTGGSALSGVHEDENLIWTKAYGNGTVMAMAYSMTLKPASDYRQSPALFKAMIDKGTKAISASHIKDMNYGNFKTSWTLRDVLGSFFVSGRPNRGILSLLLFIFAAIPVPAYLILKKKDRREWLWGLIPSAALITSVLIFTVTGSFRVRYPMLSSLTIMTQDGFDGEIASGKCYSQILLPSARAYEVPFSNQLINVGGKFTQYYYGNYYTGSREISRDYKTAIMETPAGYIIRTKKDGTFQTEEVSFDYTGDRFEGMGLTADLTRTLNTIRGTVTNHTGYDLTGVALMGQDFLIGVGNVKAGETLEVNGAINGGFIYYNSLYDIDVPGLENDIDKRALVRNLYQVCSDLYMSYNGNGTFSDDQTYVMGYVEGFEEDYVTDERIRERNHALIMARGQLYIDGYENSSMRRLLDFMVGDPNGFDTYDGQLFETEVELTVGFAGEYKEIYGLIKAEEAAGDGYYADGKTDNTTIWAFNYETGNWDELFKDEDVYMCEEGCPYLDDAMMMQLMIRCQNPYEDYIPQMTVIGGGWNAAN